MNIIETIATGTLVGLGLWFGRKWLRRINGFDASEAVPPIEPFARQGDVAAVKGEVVPWGAPRPGIDMLRAYVMKRFGGKDAGVWGDKAHQSRVSDHNVGRAWDWGLPTEDAWEELYQWLSHNHWEWARRLGVGTIIHNGRIWSAWVDGDKPMQRAYTGSNPHRTHVHFSLSRDGAMGKTSGYDMLKAA